MFLEYQKDFCLNSDEDLNSDDERKKSVFAPFFDFKSSLKEYTADRKLNELDKRLIFGITQTKMIHHLNESTRQV